MKKISKRLLSAVLAAVLAATMLIPASAAFAKGAFEGKTIIIHTSNLRGDVDKLPKIAQVKQTCLQLGANVILVDTGNFLQGSLYSSADKGYTVFTLMEKAGYNLVALGKYDFAFGNAQTGAKPHGTLKQYLTLSQLLNGGENDLLKKEKSDIVAISSNSEGSNSYYTFTGQMGRSAEVDGIDFFGYTDPAVENHVVENSLAGITFKELKSVKKDGKFTVCLSNAGSVDADLCIAPNGNDFEIGAYIIDENNNANSFIVNLEEFVDNQIVLDEVTTARSAIDGAYPDNSLAKSKVVLNGSQKAVRSEETNLGDLWCDALLKYGNGAATEVPKENIVSIWNGGNLRDFLYDGNINIEDIHKVLPYPNTVAVAYVKGSTLLEALEAAGQYDAAFASVAGMKYKINNYYEFEGGEEYEGSTYKQPLSNRVSITEVNGKAFDKNAVYAVVTSNMIFNGGDTYLAFKNKAEGYNSFNSSDKVVNVVWNYIKDDLNGVIPETYAAAQGRISIVNEAPEVPKTSINNAVVSGITAKVYTGKEIKQAVKVTLGGKVLTAADYDVSYSNNTNVGTASLTITGKGNYDGSVTKTFDIIPNGTSIKKIKKGKKYTVIWKKQKVQTTGYQIQYSLNKNFSGKKTKTVNVKSFKTSKKKIKKLKKGKKHYVRIRTYKKVGNKVYYSNWSKAKAVK